MASGAVSPAAPREDHLRRGLRVDVDRVPAHDPADRRGRDRRSDRRRRQSRARPPVRARGRARLHRDLPHLPTPPKPRVRCDRPRDAPAQRPVRAPPTTRDRLPRPVAIGPAALARQFRHLRDPPVLRLRRDLPARDHRRGDRHLHPVVVPLSATRLPHDLHRGPRAAALPSLRAALPRNRPIHPRPDGRPHDGDRGIRQGDPRHQGVRTRERSIRALRRAVSRAAIARTAARSRAHELRVGARLHPQPHARRRALRGCARRRFGCALDRWAGRFHLVRLDVGLADRSARLDPGHGRGSRNRGGPRVGGLRHRPAHRRQARRAHLGAGRR